MRTRNCDAQVPSCCESPRRGLYLLCNGLGRIATRRRDRRPHLCSRGRFDVAVVLVSILSSVMENLPGAAALRTMRYQAASTARSQSPLDQVGVMLVRSESGACSSMQAQRCDGTDRLLRV